MMRRLYLSIATALLLLGLSSPRAAALSLSQLRTAARVQLRDSSSDVTYQRFSDSTLNAFFNEAQRDFLNQTWLLSGVYSFDLTASQQEYAMPADYIVALRVKIANRAIAEVSQAGLDNNPGGNWTATVSTPTAYYMNPMQNSTTQKMGFQPTPRLTTTGSQVQVQYVQQASTLSADSDVPFNSKSLYLPYHDALVDYVAYKGWQLLGRDDLANGYLAIYASKAKLCKANLGSMPNFNPSASGYRGPPQQ